MRAILYKNSSGCWIADQYDGKGLSCEMRFHLPKGYFADQLVFGERAIFDQDGCVVDLGCDAATGLPTIKGRILKRAS